MDEREKQLRVEGARLERECEELRKKRKALDPKVAMVNYGEKMKPVEDVEKWLAEAEKVDNEINEAEAKLKEIREELKNLPREQG